MYKEYNEEIPIYKGQLVVVICDNSSEFKNKYSDFPHSEIFAHSFGREFNGEEGYFALLNPNSKYEKITQGVIAHEALHIVNILFEQRGVSYQLDNDEHACYMLQWIVDKINSYLNK